MIADFCSLVKANRGRENRGKEKRINTRKNYGSEVNSIARRGQGGDPPCGVQRRRLWWGLGQRPNCCTVKPIMLNTLNPAALVAGSAASLRSKFARPQTRPPSRFPHNLHIVAPDGRDRPASGTIRFSVLVFFVAGISPLRRRPEGFAVALWTASHPHLS